MKTLLLALIAFTMSLKAETKVLAFAGSTRAGSYNQKLVLEAADIARKMGATVTVIDFKDFPMPLYDTALEEKGMPAQAKRLRQLMIQSDAIIIASPEHNASISATLKNALDWTSRNAGSYSAEAYQGKKFAIMSASPGKGGGARGLVHLRAIIEAVGGDVMAKQVSVPTAHQAFDAKGKLESASLTQELQQEIQQLIPASLAKNDAASKKL
ncbi:MAG: NAD(P)H-dependent oxidoreductase [Verrucomicrobia bacterium]|nr:NAD(P)H-dependent oxidoreductase [Verrucomicrobiota bacterium]